LKARRSTSSRTASRTADWWSPRLGDARLCGQQRDIGLPFPTLDRLLPPERQGQERGVARGKIKRCSACRSASGRGAGLRNQRPELRPNADRNAHADVPMDQAVPLFTASIRSRRSAATGCQRIVIERFQPTAATIVAVIAAIEVGER
jgi:hypothetical protein